MKASMAETTFRAARVTDVVELVSGDAREHLAHCADIAFCFLDAEKNVYADCYEAVIPNMVAGGIWLRTTRSTTAKPCNPCSIARYRTNASMH
jgi:predicted O-methyltransferase YrrM